jgi:hypothetical protein
MLKKSWMALIVLVLLVHASYLLGDDCAQCHAAKGVRESTPAVAPIMIKAEGKTRSISLSDAFGFHGHSCPGMTTAYRALQYGILLLFGKEIPEQDDLVIFSKTPTPGSLDLLDLIMIGENRKERTVAPKGMQSSPDNFSYMLYRKSTHTAVDIHLKPEHYPKDFFALKRKQSADTLTSEEWDTLHGYMKAIILTFPSKSFEDLFGMPQPYKTITWGTLIPAHGSTSE